jgi:hypothetical protein
MPLMTKINLLCRQVKYVALKKIIPQSRRKRAWGDPAVEIEKDLNCPAMGHADSPYYSAAGMSCI